MAVLLIDSNSVGHAANAATRLTAGDIETQAIFGTLNSVRDLIIKYNGFTPICTWDGYAKWRYDLYPGYKAKRTPDPNKVLKPYEIEAQRKRASYHEQKPYIIEGLRLLGVRQIVPEHDEADDLAGYLAKDFSAKDKKVILVSRDHDWLQLVDENVSWFNPVDNETVTNLHFNEYTGYEHAHQFVSEKCLIGDSSDNIGGVDGIGKKAAPLILNHYGSVENMLNQLEGKDSTWSPPIIELNRYRKKMLAFAEKDSDGRKIYDRNMRLMCLLDVRKPSNISVIKTPLNEDKFKELCYSLAFHSILRKFDEWLKPFEGI